MFGFLRQKVLQLRLAASSSIHKLYFQGLLKAPYVICICFISLESIGNFLEFSFPFSKLSLGLNDKASVFVFLAEVRALQRNNTHLLTSAVFHFQSGFLSYVTKKFGGFLQKRPFRFENSIALLPEL